MAIAVDSTVEMDTHLHHNAVNILLAIYDATDETANTTQIGAVTGLSSANISGNHAQTLEREGLIERTGTVESTAPNDTNEYTVTPLGRKEAKRLLNQTDAEVPMSDGEKLALLNYLKENREALEQPPEQGRPNTVGREEPEEIRRLRERVDELEEKADEHDTTISTLDTRFERLTNIVKSLRA